MTWPVVAHLNTQLIGGHVDQWTHLWTFNWVKESLFNNLFYTDAVFHPVGVSLATHNIAWLNIIMWLPLQALFGGIAAYNLVFLIILSLNGFAIYLLADEIVNSKPASFIAGLIITIWPYILSHHDHPNMIFIAWIPLSLLFLRRALIKRTRRDAGLAILFIALISWARLHLFIMGSLLLGLYAIYLLATNFDKDNCKRVASIFFIAGILSIPAAIPVALSQISDDTPEDIFLDQQDTRQTDLLAYIVPSFYHPLWQKGPLAEKINLYNDPDRIVPRTPFLGYTLIFLALSAFFVKHRRKWFWGVTAVLYILIALGPILRVNGTFYPDFPMPYRLIEDIYFVRILRQPQRFNIILGIPLAILAAQGAKYWLQRWSNKYKPSSVILLFVGIILFEFAPFPFPITEHKTASWFSELANDPDDFAILNIPVGTFNVDKRHMFDQLTHGRPIVNGKVARVPTEALAFFNSTPFLRSVFDNKVDFYQATVTQALRPLATNNVRYLVLHKDLLTVEELTAWQNWLAFSPEHEDDELLVYSTAPQISRDFEISHSVNDELSLIQATISTETSSSFGLIQADFLWFASKRPPTDYDVCFLLTASGVPDSQTYCTAVIEAWPTSKWAAEDIFHGRYYFQIDSALPSNNYSLSIQLRQPGSETAVSQSIPMSQINISQTSWPVQWDDKILLNRYEVEPMPSSLDVTFQWEALASMDISYKIFLHVYDLENNELVSQSDFYPLDWTYFTNQWQVGEIIEDSISIPLQTIPPGSYQLILGFYNEENGERLPINNSDDSVLLTKFTR
ncbi:MAG: hypothetical protein DHS20C20_06760 [Ardenticatenaceae bacterium]|nr:MAG: hypothetical protein DHS20C20_06760 [Ardenticatenaceae bacterium]